MRLPVNQALLMPLAWCAFLAFGLGLTLAVPEASAIDDPTLDFRTLTTPHFYVHYYSDVENLAFRTAQAAEEAHLILQPLLEWQPADRTHIIINDRLDTANGSANVYGRNVINIFGMPPEADSVLGYYDDWLRILVFHEYVHVLHLDTTLGLPPYLNTIIGKQYNPNQVLPRWYVEGIAVYHESARTGTGRLNSSLWQMWLRTAVLEDGFFDLGTVTGVPTIWPFGNASYLYGSFFVQWIAQNYGESSLTAFHRAYGGRLVPYSMNQIARDLWGDSFHELWPQWKAEFAGQSWAKKVAIEAQGRTPVERVTPLPSSSFYPRLRPGSGQISYFKQDFFDHPSYVITEADQPHSEVRPLFEVDGAAGPGDWSANGEEFVYSRATIFKNVYSYQDLYIWHAPTDQHRRLTKGERAREPAISPKGERIAYVRNVDGTMELVVRRYASGPTGEERVLVGGTKWPPQDERHWQQISMPTWTADGRSVVFSWWRLDRRTRDLWLFDLDAPAEKALRPLTRDVAHDMDPYVDDTNTLYFSSDREGIFNIYAMPLGRDNKPLKSASRISTVVSGVFAPRPSPDKRWIYVSVYTAEGYAIGRFPRPELNPKPLLGNPGERPVEASLNSEQIPKEQGSLPRAKHQPARSFVRTVVMNAIEQARRASPKSTANAVLLDADRVAKPWKSPRQEALSTGYSRNYPTVDTSAWRAEEYKPLQWLAPLFFIPELSASTQGTSLGISISGNDPLARHSYTLSAGITMGGDTESGSQPNAGISYGFFGWPFNINTRLNYRQYPRTRSLVANANFVPFIEEQLLGRLSLSYPIRRVDDSIQLSLYYQLDQRGFWSEPNIDFGDPGALEPVFPEQGAFNELGFSASYSWLESFPYSVSVERGYSITAGLSLLDPLLGSDYNAVTFNYGASGYYPVPFIQRHVLALTMNGALVTSDFRDPRRFGIGGFAPQDVFSSLVFQNAGGGYRIRGYEPFAFAGSQFQVWNAEYRFPILDLDEGFSTIPIYLRRIKGRVFFDVGTAYEGYLADADWKTGTGAEVELDTVLGYFLSGSLRLGYARGLSEEGIDQVYLLYGSGF